MNKDQTTNEKASKPRKQRLELTWIGKDEELKIEPRILIEDPEKSYGDPNSENMLIHGDNLLALKALEQDFAGKIKCIYIDPPFNTGSAFEHYVDGLEHSIWLDLMYKRLVLLHRLLSEDGIIVVHIDYNEDAYLRVLLDEIFGRSNFRNNINVARIKKNVRERERVKALNIAQDSLLLYVKNTNTTILPPMKENKKPERWHGFEAAGYRKGMDYELFGHKPLEKNHWRWTKENAYNAVTNYKLWKDKYSISMTLTEYWKSNQKLKFIKPNPKTQKPEYFIPASDLEIVDTNWMDITASSFKWKFPNGEKNETLVERILMLNTNKGDLILDSFLGSGTTAAVAHKMNRKWIGIELGEHANTHCLPRLKKVIDGTDQSGISKSVNWQGGGGFKFYNLAPSLLRKDNYNNWVIDEKYNANMLASAMCKHEGFKFSPREEIYWKQGQSTEKDFIFVTTSFVTVEQLDKIHEEMSDEESLLICAKSFSPECKDSYPSITIKKIPKILLDRCEFGKDNYDLNIIQETEDFDDIIEEEEYE